jgi:biopolymer transport protein TolR
MRRARRRYVSEINVVPYIDVMLVLLVIFMITTPLLTQGVDISLPQAKAKPIEQPRRMPLIVTIDKEGHQYLNVATKPDNPLTSRALVTLVAAQLQIAKEAGIHREVLVRGDANANYGNVVAAMTLLQKAGVENIGLITETPREGR